MANNRYVIVRKSGAMEDIGAHSMEFNRTHIMFCDEDKTPLFVIHTDEVREMTFEWDLESKD